MKLDLKPFLDQGFNKSEANILAGAEVLEDKLLDIKMRYQGNIDSSFWIDLWCEDCKIGGLFMPSAVIMFIYRHKDHKTRSLKLR